jgi:hypothetical protein
VLAVAGVLAAVAIVRLPGRGGHIPYEGIKAGTARPAELPGILLAALATHGLGLVLGPEAPLATHGLGLVLGPEAPLIALGGGLAILAVKLVKKGPPPARSWRCSPPARRSPRSPLSSARRSSARSS